MHGHLARPQPKLLGNDQVFDIEAERIPQVPREHCLSRIVPVQLERALRVPVWKPRHHSHEQVERPPAPFPKYRLMHPRIDRPTPLAGVTVALAGQNNSTSIRWAANLVRRYQQEALTRTGDEDCGRPLGGALDESLDL